MPEQETDLESENKKAASKMQLFLPNSAKLPYNKLYPPGVVTKQQVLQLVLQPG
jgi:hypothetical protein